MRTITAKIIKDTVADLCIRANIFLRPDVLQGLQQALARETKPRAKKILEAIIENARIARRQGLAVCQDTGMPLVFAEVGRKVKLRGDLRAAINKGIELGYRRGFLRNSIVKDPLVRGSWGYVPSVIHVDIVKGDRLKLTVLPKGFGCENKSQLKMFKPTAGISEIKQFVIDAIKGAGPDACPPYVVGVGIGGTADYACFLAKKALLRKITPSTEHRTLRTEHRDLEQALLGQINKLGIGPMGLGGRTTCLGVNIEAYPTHIAGLPVAVNISCHALRSATKKI